MTGVCGIDERLEPMVLPLPTVYFSGNSEHKSGRSFNEKKIINDINITIDEKNMWKYFISKGFRFLSNKNSNSSSDNSNATSLFLRFELPNTLCLKGLRVWNYNGGGIDGLCYGVKHCKIVVNDSLEFPVRIIRKASGQDTFNYGQYIPFSFSDSSIGGVYTMAIFLFSNFIC
jgi:hypothetical protein